MKYLLIIFIAVAAATLGYHFGFAAGAAGKKDQVEKALMNHLLCNLAVYQDLQKGGPQLATDSLRVYIEGDLKTYDYYKREAPDFGDGDPHLQEFVKEARAMENGKQ